MTELKCIKKENRRKREREEREERERQEREERGKREREKNQVELRKTTKGILSKRVNKEGGKLKYKPLLRLKLAFTALKGTSINNYAQIVYLNQAKTAKDMLDLKCPQFNPFVNYCNVSKFTWLAYRQKVKKLRGVGLYN